MPHRLLFFIAALVVSSTAVAQTEQPRTAATAGGLLAGVARANIDPAYGSPHVSWGSQTHIVDDGRDPVGMRLTALALSDGRQKFVIVDIDMTSLDPEWSDVAAMRAAKAIGIPRDHVRLTATHTHSPPHLVTGDGPAGADLTVYQPQWERYRAELMDKLVGAVVEADAALRPVSIYGGRGVGTIGINRRFRGQAGGPPAVGLNFKGFADRDLIVYRIDDAHGDPYAVLVNFQAHGTVLGGKNTKVSPDYPGTVRAVVEQALPGATALFVQGAAGNQGPIDGYSGDVTLAHRLGAILGHEAAAVALQIDTQDRRPQFEGYIQSTARQAIQPYRVVGPRDQTLRYAREVVELPAQVHTETERAKMQQEIDVARRDAQRYAATDVSFGALQARAAVRRAELLLKRWSDPPGKPIAYEIRILAIGDIAIVGTPGEMFAETGAAIKNASPFAYTMISGYSDANSGSRGYMPSGPEYNRGGYEVDMTAYAKGDAEKVATAVIAMLKALHR